MTLRVHQALAFRLVPSALLLLFLLFFFFFFLPLLGSACFGRSGT